MGTIAVEVAQDSEGKNKQKLAGMSKNLSKSRSSRCTGRVVRIQNIQVHLNFR